MPGTNQSRVYRVESDRAARRLRFRNEGGDQKRFLDISGLQGLVLPAVLTDPVVEALDDPDRPPRSWRIQSIEGRFEFQALAVQMIEECPSLYAPLHRPFSLGTADRLAVRILLWLLQLPGGAGLLRRWHAHRH
ncbi:MAG: hypothetical protein ACREVZ_08045 [Burkholderiales bacterium]